MTAETKPLDATEGLRDPLEAMRDRGKSPEVAALLAWVIPGAGHLYAGHKVKAAGGLVFVLGLFMWGLFLSGGEAVSLDDEQGHPYAFLAQVGAGGPTSVGLIYSRTSLERPTGNEEFEDPAYCRGHPDRDTGLLFTMIAGLLNLLLVHDALGGVPGGLMRRREEKRRRERLDALRAELEAERVAKAGGGGSEDAEADAASADSAKETE